MTIKKKTRIFSAVAVGILMLIIFILSAQEGSASDEISLSVTGLLFNGDLVAALNVIVRKLAHVSEYAALSVPLYLFFSTFEINKSMKIIFPFSVSVFYAATDEFHQLFVEGRSGQIRDVMIDSIGAVLGIIFIIVLSSFLSAINKRRSGNAE